MSQSYDAWIATVVRTLIEHGVPMLEAKNIVADNDEWFQGAFDGGESAVLTADDWYNENYGKHSCNHAALDAAVALKERHGAVIKESA